ncbi:uncharacterized protein LOC106868078 isoform X2 [Octopus bimaculoides]|uniref:uncharacterized protein LOC106868078 isoform X2 n=1 Tax=Octopus bimaculoides TaxID=37653 RepID=UPI0022E2714B|nr:uncharacterized protein LOC106868078 isoform X2 [Octopus bimaculoides]
MAPPALINPFSSHEACDEMASPKVCHLTTPREDGFTYGAPKSSNGDSLIDFIAKLSVVHLQRHMLFMQLNCGDCTHSNISRILNTKNIEMNRQHAKNAVGSIPDTIALTPVSDDADTPFDLAIEYDSLISESNSLENPSDEEEAYSPKSEYDLLFSPSSKSSMNSTTLDSFTDLHSSAHDGQDSDDDGHFSFEDASGDENWDFNSDTNCNDLPCTKDVPFWKTVFQLVESDDECDSDDYDEDYDDDILFSNTPCFSFNELFENTQNTKTENTDSIPSIIGKANDRWNKIYTDTNVHHKTSKNNRKILGSIRCLQEWFCIA